QCENREREPLEPIDSHVPSAYRSTRRGPGVAGIEPARAAQSQTASTVCSRRTRPKDGGASRTETGMVRTVLLIGAGLAAGLAAVYWLAGPSSTAEPSRLAESPPAPS